MSLAAYVRAMGRGPSRARSLERQEAEHAFQMILNGEAEPEAVGALLMLMRYRGETAAEVAGFVDAARARLEPWQDVGAAIDWPSYAAGRSRGLPWFLLSAKLVAEAGYPVMLHGWNSHQQEAASVRAQLSSLGIKTAETAQDCARVLAKDRIVYVPLEAMDPALFRILGLRSVLGLRSAVNTVLRMSNPSRAFVSLQGVFHPSYRLLQQEAGALLGQAALCVLKGGGGEFERHPAKAIELFGLHEGRAFDTVAEPIVGATRRLADATPDPNHPAELWQSRHRDVFAEHVIQGTAAIALWMQNAALDLKSAEDTARQLWRSRKADSLQLEEFC